MANADGDDTEFRWRDADHPCVLLVGLHDHRNERLRSLNWKVGRLGLADGAVRRDAATTDACLRVVFDGKGGCERLVAVAGGEQRKDGGSGSAHGPAAEHVPLRNLLFYGKRRASSGPHERLQTLLNWRAWLAARSADEQEQYRPARLGHFPPEAMDYVEDVEQCYRTLLAEYTKDGQPDYDGLFQHIEMAHGLRMGHRRLTTLYSEQPAMLERLRRGDLDTSEQMTHLVEQYWTEVLDPIVDLPHRKAFAKTMLVDSLFNFDDPANCHVDASFEHMLSQMKVSPPPAAP